MTSSFKPYFPEEYNYKVISVNDMPQENLLLYLDEGVDFIADALSYEQTILVHCNAGISRSASFVIAYLMREKNMPFEEAIAFVKKKRISVFPNVGFIK